MIPPSPSEHPVRTSRLLLAALLVAGGCSAPDAAKSGTEPVVLGLAGPFEQEWGTTVRMGAELARKQINDAGGIDGRRLEFHVVNDDGDPERALAVAQELFQDPSVVAVVGHATSSATTAAAPVYDRGLAALATSATSPDVSRLGPWVFRVAPSDSSTAGELARVARGLNARVAVLYQNDDYGRGMLRSFSHAMSAESAHFLEADPYLPITQDFGPYLRRLQRWGVQLVFIAGLHDGAARIVTQARAVGLDARFIGGDGIEALASLGQASEGALIGLLYHASASPRARAFAEEFRAEYGREADSFAAHAYDAVNLLARGIAEGNRDRESLRNYLDGVGRTEESPAFEGVSGTLRFDVNGDPVDKQIAIGVVQGGAIELLPDSR